MLSFSVDVAVPGVVGLFEAFRSQQGNLPLSYVLP